MSIEYTYKMIEVILCCSSNGGIGFDNKLPWNIPSEMSMFRAKTMGCSLIVGRNTYESLPHLDGRTVIVVGSGKDQHNTIESAISSAKPDTRRIIIGGKQVYDYTFKNLKHLISTIHLSVVKDEYPTINTYIDMKLDDFFIHYKCVEKLDFKQFTHYTFKPEMQTGEIQYLNLLRDVLTTGELEKGRNGLVSRKFYSDLHFDLSDGFPLLTTKRMFLRGIIEELLFFLRGQTDSKILENKGVSIWKGNTSKDFIDKCHLDYREGLMGPMYGYMWRHYGAEYDASQAGPKTPGIDQLMNVIHLIKTDPTSRRILMTDFNPSQVNEGVLYPCHSIILQFFVSNDRLNMICYNRSSDLFLGLPFNIASSSLLLMLIAKMTGLKPGMFHLNLGDCHIYRSHYEAVALQLVRLPYAIPTLTIKDFSTIDELTIDHFQLVNYTSYGTIKAEMIV